MDKLHCKECYEMTKEKIGQFNIFFKKEWKCAIKILNDRIAEQEIEMQKEKENEEIIYSQKDNIKIIHELETKNRKWKEKIKWLKQN